METAREPTEVREFVPSVCACVHASIRACARRVHCRCSLPPHPDATGALCVPLLLAPSPRAASRCPSCLSASIPFDHTHEIHLVRLASPRLVSLRFASSSFSLPAARALFPAALSRSRCNERCTLLLSSSCSRRRCFYSAAQSVSAWLPTRFARRFASAPNVHLSLIQNESKSTWQEIEIEGLDLSQLTLS